MKKIFNKTYFFGILLAIFTIASGIRLMSINPVTHITTDVALGFICILSGIWIVTHPLIISRRK